MFLRFSFSSPLYRKEDRRRTKYRMASGVPFQDIQLKTFESDCSFIRPNVHCEPCGRQNHFTMTPQPTSSSGSPEKKKNRRRSPRYKMDPLRDCGKENLIKVDYFSLAQFSWSSPGKSQRQHLERSENFLFPPKACCAPNRPTRSSTRGDRGKQRKFCNFCP